MKHVRTYTAAALVSLLALLCLAGSGLAPGGASRAGLKVVRAVSPAAAAEARQDEPARRVSPDLLELARDPEAGGRRVRVILQERAGLDALLGSGLGAEVKTRGRFESLDARVVELPARLVERLSEQKGVRFLSLDRETTGFGHVSRTTGTDEVRETEGKNVSGLDGEGIGIAVLDSGIDTGHSKFFDRRDGLRVVYSKDFTGEGRTDDPFGHGTHVAGIVGGNGRIARAESIGVAPNANLINLRVLNKMGTGRVSYILAALDWVYQNRAAYNIRVVNLSLGTAAVESYKHDPVCKAVRKLVDAGVVVVAAAGNNGKDAAGQKLYGAIHSPGSEPSVITVGATNTFGTDARSDDAVASFSSRGPTRGGWTDLLGVRHHDNLVKPDLVAPGNKIIDAAAEDNYLITKHPELDAGVSHADSRRMMYLNGTSMATPTVAGAAALMIQANPTLTPNLVKALLMYTAQQLPGANLLEQGAGELNVEGAVRLARLVRRDLSAQTPVGAPLLVSTVPAPATQTTIAGETFVWSQGIVVRHGYATGAELISKYQKIYALGVIATDAVFTVDGVIATDRKFLTSGVIATDNILISSGQLLGDGSVFLASGVIATDRFFGILGVIATDRPVFGDGVIATDCVLDADTLAQALSAATNGEATRAGPPAPDTGLDCLDCD
ncbi:MAG: S8 family peptidase [Pyrinomonadaceae bacterium]